MLVKILYKAKWQYSTLDKNALILKYSTVAREYSCPYSIKMILIPTIYQWIMHDKVWYSKVTIKKLKGEKELKLLLIQKHEIIFTSKAVKEQKK